MGSIEIKSKKKMSKTKKIIIILVSLFVVMGGSFAFLLYGPYSGFREWLITTAMTTMSHQYLATWFYSDETINEVLNNNVVIESGDSTDTSLIDFDDIDFNSYANEYEKEILTKDEGNDIYKLINITGNGYKGYLVAVYDPKKVEVVTSKYLGSSGQYLVDMAKENDAVVAINGGGFDDPEYMSTGGRPLGVVIHNGKIVTNGDYGSSGFGGIIGFTSDGKFYLGKESASEAISNGIKEAVSFGPFLIVNGKRAFIKGNGGWGTAPRTAIGQRKDGIVLFLVIDGRTVSNPGADMVDLTDIMERYGAYNAANLDGGTSCGLVINNKLINDPISGSGKHSTRPIPTGFIVKR